MVAVGRVLRFDEVRGYGFIAPSGGGEDVFVHANDFGDQRHLVHAGVRVEYEVEQGDRGLKVASVRILADPVPVSAPGRGGTHPERTSATATGDDDGMCDVLAAREFIVEITEVLLQHVPSLTAAQITQVRQHLVNHARSHGWVES